MQWGWKSDSKTIKFISRLFDGAGHLSSTPLIIPKLNPADTNNQNILVSKSPDRNQFIQTPWLGIVVGLATIAALGFIASRLYQNPKSNS
ncbi:hypothetical protein EBS67_14025 [bacterium]|nr:hypothetical protein [bacterium]